MKVHNLSELLSCALEGAARYIVAYCDSAGAPTNKAHSYGGNEPQPENIISAKLQKHTSLSSPEVDYSSMPADDDVPPPTDADAPPDTIENYTYVPEQPDAILEKIDDVPSDKAADAFEPAPAAIESAEEQGVVVDGVPAGHPIHDEVTTLLPDFRAISAMVQKDDFVVTPQSVEMAMPVWVSFNALSKYREDEHFPAILAYVRTYIKPVCFAAMGKEIGK